MGSRGQQTDNDWETRNNTDTTLMVHHGCGSSAIETVLQPKIVLLLVLSSLIVVCNGALIWTILTHKYLRKKSNYFVVALAVADFMLGCLSAPLHVMGEAGVIAQSYNGCLAIMALSCAQIVLSVMMLLALSLERYLKLSHPFLYTKMVTEQRIVVTITFCVVYSLLFGFLPLLGWNNVDSASTYSGPYTCRFTIVLSGSYVGVLFLGHIVPTFFLLPIMHLRVFLTAHRLLRRTSLRSFRTSLHRASNVSSVPSRDSHTITLPILSRQRNYRHFKILVVMGMYFIVSWMPLTVWEAVLWDGFTKDAITVQDLLCPAIKMKVYYVVLGLAIANSAINPIIFGAGNTTIRRTFLRPLFRHKHGSAEDISKSFGSLTENRMQEMSVMYPIKSQRPEATSRLTDNTSLRSSWSSYTHSRSPPRGMHRSPSCLDDTYVTTPALCTGDLVLLNEKRESKVTFVQN